jgi:TonB family protein
MRLLQKLALVVLVGCASAWAQTGSTAPQQGDASTQTSQPSQTTSEPDKKAPAEPPPAARSGDSTALEALKIEKAQYPEAAREKQLQGQVWVKIHVSETGDVEGVEVISGDPILADAAVHAAKKWKFKPFLRNGKPAKVSTKLPFDFAFAENIHEENIHQEKVRDQKVPPVEGTAGNLAKPPSAGEAPQRVRVSLGVSQSLLLRQVAPVYPVEARRARIQGTVLLRAKISKEGRITDLEVISGPKELTPAAIGAVQQWLYRPYLLMGEPVQVETQIQVNFQLRY